MAWEGEKKRHRKPHGGDTFPSLFTCPHSRLGNARIMTGLNFQSGSSSRRRTSLEKICVETSCCGVRSGSEVWGGWAEGGRKGEREEEKESEVLCRNVLQLTVWFSQLFKYCHHFVRWIVTPSATLYHFKWWWSKHVCGGLPLLLDVLVRSEEDICCLSLTVKSTTQTSEFRKISDDSGCSGRVGMPGSCDSDLHCEFYKRWEYCFYYKVELSSVTMVIITLVTPTETHNEAHAEE